MKQLLISTLQIKPCNIANQTSLKPAEIMENETNKQKKRLIFPRSPRSYRATPSSGDTQKVWMWDLWKSGYPVGLIFKKSSPKYMNWPNMFYHYYYFFCIHVYVVLCNCCRLLCHVTQPGLQRSLTLLSILPNESLRFDCFGLCHVLMKWSDTGTKRPWPVSVR